MSSQPRAYSRRLPLRLLAWVALAPRSTVSLWLTWMMCVSIGCGDDDRRIQTPPLPDATMMMDAGHEDAAVRECERDEQCNDGIECTVDRCQWNGMCQSLSDNSRCSDGVFCNGLEFCNPAAGCEPAAPLTCNDDEVCTIDRCDEAAKRCTHRPRDFDGDGEVDVHCGGGTDCNDFEPTQGTQSAEICGDGTDNDCDDTIDENACGGPPHDTCEDALDISGGGIFMLRLRGATTSYGLSCGTTGQRDLALAFTLDAPADVSLEAQGLWVDGGTEAANIAVRGRCGDASSELTCGSGFPARVRMRSLPAGDYSVIVNSSVNAQSVLVKLALSAPTPAPTNIDCSTPRELGAGGRVEADFVDVTDHLDLSCGFEGSPDLTYAIDVTEPSDMVVTSYLPPGERISISLRTDCEDTTSELRCITGTPAFGRFRGITPGRYYLVVEGPFSREVDFSLDVDLQAPTPEPEGDSCQSAIDLPLMTTINGTLTGRQDLVETCGFFYRDIVYNVHVDQPTDLRVEVDAGDSLVTLAVQRECGDVTSQASCVNGQPASTRLRNLAAGDYSVIIEAQSDVSFTVFAEQVPLTVPVEIEPTNDTCITPYEVSEAGGLFVGTTLPLIADYKAGCGGPAQSKDAVFMLRALQPRRVRVTLEGGYDTVLYRYYDSTNGNPGVCVPFAETSCNDDVDISTRSVLDESLGVGTHYYVVSGFGASSSGNYTIEFDTDAM